MKKLFSKNYRLLRAKFLFVCISWFRMNRRIARRIAVMLFVRYRRNPPMQYRHFKYHTKVLFVGDCIVADFLVLIS